MPELQVRGKALTLRGVVLVALALAVALVAVSTAGASGPGARFNPPKGYYLSLGDSLGFGLQLDKLNALLAAGTYTPHAFNTGYTDDFAAQMLQIRPDQQVVNLSCPRETTDTMISGGCPFIDFGLAIHTDYSGAQLDAAIAFLKAHPGQVSPITVGIGANDAIGVLGDQCNFDPTCAKAASSNTSRRTSTRSWALSAPQPRTPKSSWSPTTTRLGFTSTHRPTSFGITTTFKSSRTPPLVIDAFFANGFDAISTTDQLCQLTFLCASGDVHPTDTGYQVLANLIDSVSGYDRLTSN
jgi:lysophospholipase L1-like esterase